VCYIGSMNETAQEIGVDTLDLTNVRDIV
jgi:hypothetical protein